MKYLRFLPLILGVSASISAACAQHATKSTEAIKPPEFHYSDDNVSRDDLARKKAEHSKNWIRTHKPSPPSEANVYYLPETGAETAGIRSRTNTFIAKSPAESGPVHIKPKEIGELGLSDTCKAQVSNPKAIIMLSSKNHKFPVAVLQLEQDGTAILDPDGFEYPKHLLLSEMTEQTAKRYWGSPKLNKDGYSTFKLSSADNATIQIDATFENKKFATYRVRGAQISKESWISIKEGGEQAPPQ